MGFGRVLDQDINLVVMTPEPLERLHPVAVRRESSETFVELVYLPGLVFPAVLAGGETGTFLLVDVQSDTYFHVFSSALAKPVGYHHISENRSETWPSVLLVQLQYRWPLILK